MSTNNPIKITITPLRPTHKGTPYAAFLDHRQIVERSYAPSFAACRWLVEQGFTGPAEIWHPGEQYPRMRIASIEFAAKFTVREGEAHGPRIVPFKAFDPAHFQQQEVAGRQPKPNTLPRPGFKKGAVTFRSDSCGFPIVKS